MLVSTCDRRLLKRITNFSTYSTPKNPHPMMKSGNGYVILFGASRASSRISRTCQLITSQHVVHDLSNGVSFNDLDGLEFPDFKVIPLFDVEYLRNDTRRTGYCKPVIKSDMWPTELCHRQNIDQGHFSDFV